MGFPSSVDYKKPRSLSLPLPAQVDMDRHPHIYAESTLAGVAKIEEGCICSAIVGESEKESALPVVEMLDEVRDVLRRFTQCTETT